MIFLTLPVLPQRLCSTCHLEVQAYEVRCTHRGITEKGQSPEYILKFSKQKHNIYWTPSWTSAIEIFQVRRIILTRYFVRRPYTSGRKATTLSFPSCNRFSTPSKARTRSTSSCDTLKQQPTTGCDTLKQQPNPVLLTITKKMEFKRPYILPLYCHSAHHLGGIFIWSNERDFEGHLVSIQQRVH